MISEYFDVEDKIVLFTGGSSRYGRPVVSDLAAAGATVIVTSREMDTAKKIAESERDSAGDLYPGQMDLGDTDSISALIEQIRAEFDRVDGLVNNAVARPMTGLNDDLDNWNDSMDANATGIFHLTREVASWMKDTGGGSIVNVGSIQGTVGPELALYEGTEMYNGEEKYPAPDYFFHKGGLVNLTRYFASVYGHAGIRVNCLSPGGIYNGQDEKFVQAYERQTMLGRMAEGRDLSGPVLFLLSEAASYITGANIPVDGGYTSK